MLAAPFTVSDGQYAGKYFGAAVIRRYSEHQRFYLHEVAAMEAKKDPFVAKTVVATVGSPTHETGPSVRSILQSLQKVYSENSVIGEAFHSTDTETAPGKRLGNDIYSAPPDGSIPDSETEGKTTGINAYSLLKAHTQENLSCGVAYPAGVPYNKYERAHHASEQKCKQRTKVGLSLMEALCKSH